MLKKEVKNVGNGEYCIKEKNLEEMIVGFDHFLKDLMFRRDNLKERYSLVGKRRDMIGERVELDLKHDRLWT